MMAICLPELTSGSRVVSEQQSGGQPSSVVYCPNAHAALFMFGKSHRLEAGCTFDSGQVVNSQGALLPASRLCVFAAKSPEWGLR